MARRRACMLAAALFACLRVGASATTLTTFDGASATTQTWRAENDPVMGGKSVSTFAIKDDSGLWQGEVKIVPFLRKPGFCSIRTEHAFPDLSSAKGLSVTASVGTGSLTSFKITMASSERSSSRQGEFQGTFTAKGTEFATYFIPFSSMTQSWRGQKEGGPPSQAQLKAITGLGFIQDGVAGSIDISIRSISAELSPGPAPSGKNIVELAESVSGLSTLVAAVKAADLVDTLSGAGPFTVFAPTNEAFGRLPPGTLDTLLKPQNKAQLVKILTYHVAAGSIQAADITNGEKIKTVEGDNVVARVEDDGVFIEGGTAPNLAKVIMPNVEASNGVVHVINEVLIPPASPAPAPGPSPAPAASDVVLVTFEASQTTRSWRETNDPVMGGRSTGSFVTQAGVGILDGEVKDVPFLHAPGFIKVETTDSKPFPDVSHCSALKLTLKSGTSYSGYRVSFGTDKPPNGKMFARGYKADFTAPVGQEGTVTVPFTDFTDYWDDATGKAIKTCKEDSQYCPSTKALTNLKTLGFWGEGVNGKVHLEIKAVAATGCGKPSSHAPEHQSDHTDHKSSEHHSAFSWLEKVAEHARSKYEVRSGTKWV